jgi:hypothetical protein
VYKNKDSFVKSLQLLIKSYGVPFVLDSLDSLQRSRKRRALCFRYPTKDLIITWVRHCFHKRPPFSVHLICLAFGSFYIKQRIEGTMQQQRMDTVLQKLVESRVIGDVVTDFFPCVQLYVIYRHKWISLGDELSLTVAQSQPDNIECKCEDADFEMKQILSHSKFVIFWLRQGVLKFILYPASEDNLNLQQEQSARCGENYNLQKPTYIFSWGRQKHMKTEKDAVEYNEQISPSSTKCA